MELSEVMRTNGACRRFLPDHVADDVLLRAVDNARFGPQGGNRQGVRFIAVRDRAKKQQLGDWYGVPCRAAIAEIKEAMAQDLSRDQAGHHLTAVTNIEEVFVDQLRMSDGMGDVPVVVVAVVDLNTLHLTDTNLERVSISGGASVYPMVQNFALALREQGVASVITTLLLEYEKDVQDLLEIPHEYAVAAVLPIGYPETPFPKKLTRLPAETLIFCDSFGSSLAS